MSFQSWAKQETLANQLYLNSKKIAEAFYDGVPDLIKANTLKRLDDDLKDIITQFRGKYLAQF